MINSRKDKSTFLSILMNLEGFVSIDNRVIDIVKLVDLFDLSIIENRYLSNMGRRIYTMFGIVIYGYL